MPGPSSVLDFTITDVDLAAVQRESLTVARAALAAHDAMVEFGRAAGNPSLRFLDRETLAKTRLQVAISERVLELAEAARRGDPPALGHARTSPEVAEALSSGAPSRPKGDPLELFAKALGVPSASDTIE